MKNTRVMYLKKEKGFFDEDIIVYGIQGIQIYSGNTPIYPDKINLILNREKIIENTNLRTLQNFIEVPAFYISKGTPFELQDTGNNGLVLYGYEPHEKDIEEIKEQKTIIKSLTLTEQEREGVITIPQNEKWELFNIKGYPLSTILETQYQEIRTFEMFELYSENEKLLNIPVEYLKDEDKFPKIKNTVIKHKLFARVEEFSDYELHVIFIFKVSKK
jgi:hypothetical protein